MTAVEQATDVTDLDPSQVEIPFTFRHAQMLEEIHGAITQIGAAVEQLLPKLADSPVGKMLGL